MVCIIFDMDGVIYRGNKPIPGAKEVIEFLKGNNVRFLFLTNNSTKTPEMYREKLLNMGIDVPAEIIVTSGLATRIYMEKHYPPGKVFIIGGRGLIVEMKKLGWEIISLEEAKRGKWREIDYVVVGLDPELTYEKLKYATLAIRNGALFIGTNPDTTFPGEEGIYPGAGSIIAALKASTEKEPIIIGKPNRPMYEVIKERCPGEMWMVGDRLDTDIIFAKRFGMKAIMVLTGVHSLEDIKRLNIQPDLVLQDISHLVKYISTS
ncbi:HAD-IIA family hydrolase [Pyrococcus abyssi]|uniref:Haloacid dehalogenase-like hydrolase, NagD protein homolog n=1 Tax=Pyrococcus abyssi (strain GE5 / Orsay) TaxID=272844 RepID=Q9UYA1_PYRAB|nr:HAD-IIA family hydrolase [Pyrococcus abyssi]CAB50511.1 Haloacid dehalogenase-like hydrolase, NagD protein homolog [Pyrococcus abyssi GE5]CCE71067.1 TPA: hypopthetical 4-nitrophenylphosphatase [Pyrococcus abyssi GE5]